MEVHPEYGSNADIVSQFRRHGFQCVMANEDLQTVEEPQDASFVHAWIARPA